MYFLFPPINEEHFIQTMKRGTWRIVTGFRQNEYIYAHSILIHENKISAVTPKTDESESALGPTLS